MKEKVYVCIDLKSFYASVECRERNLDPLNTNLVVADKSRTEKTICLAVSPSLKQYGIPGRARLFEVVQKVRKINYERKKQINYQKFNGKSYLNDALKNDSTLEVDYIVAPPSMKKYMNYSVEIYNIYLKYISPDDIYVYSIDEVFIDITSYLKTYNMTPDELVSKMIKDVYDKTGITATAGIGTNLFLCKVAMDIVAKHEEPNEIGVRIASLDEMTYRKLLWTHKPLTDFWRVGKGYAKKLENYHMYTMGDIARCSINNEELLYKIFGINAELLIDHAWGYEPCTMKSIKEYKPNHNCISTGQVLHCACNYKTTRLIVKEMADALSLDLADKHKITSKLVLTIGYDIENVTNPNLSKYYHDELTTDFYGRVMPKHAHGTINIKYPTSSTKIIVEKVDELFVKIVNEHLLAKRINITAADLLDEEVSKTITKYVQFDLFSNQEQVEQEQLKNEKVEQDDKKIQEALISIKNKFGKNAIVKGMDLEEGATTIDRNKQIGGHRE